MWKNKIHVPKHRRIIVILLFHIGLVRPAIFTTSFQHQSLRGVWKGQDPEDAQEKSGSQMGEIDHVSILSISISINLYTSI